MDFHFENEIKNVVIGNQNRVSFHYSDGKKRTVPFLAPRVPNEGVFCREVELKRAITWAVHNADIAFLGSPGVGKSTLAAKLAVEAAALFPDGVFWARMGPHATEETMLLTLAEWAEILGIPSRSVRTAKTIEERAKVVSAAIGKRRMLFVIDDAWNTPIALTMKVGGPFCAMLVTTRSPEVASSFAGQNIISLGSLSTSGSEELLKKFIPGNGSLSDKELVPILQSVDGNPLGLVLLGHQIRVALLTGGKQQALEAMAKYTRAVDRLSASRMEDPSHHPPYLSFGTPLSLAAAIEVSIASLSEDVVSALSSLAILPPKPNSFGIAALEAVAGSSHTSDALLRSGILENVGSERNAIHQTVWDYVTVFCKAESPRSLRLVQAYISLCENHQGRSKADLQALDTERENLAAIFDLPLLTQESDLFLKGSMALHAYLEIRGLYARAETLLDRGIKISTKVGMLRHIPMMLARRASVSEKIGHYAQAERLYKKALKMARVANNTAVEIYAEQNLGVLFSKMGAPVACMNHLRKALLLAREENDTLRVATALKNLAAQTVRTGAFKEARAYLDEAFDLTGGLSDRSRHAGVLTNLGFLHINLGNYPLAEKYLREGTDVNNALGDRDKLGLILTYRGLLQVKRGEFDIAQITLQTGLDLTTFLKQPQRIGLLKAYLGHIETLRGRLSVAEEFLYAAREESKKLGNGENKCMALIFSGDLAVAKKRHEEAMKFYKMAMLIAKKIGYVRLEAVILLEMGRCSEYLGSYEKGREYVQSCLLLAKKMAHKELIAFSHFSIGRIEECEGKNAQAKHSYGMALEIFERLGHYAHAELLKRFKSV